MPAQPPEEIAVNSTPDPAASGPQPPTPAPSYPPPAPIPPAMGPAAQSAREAPGARGFALSNWAIVVAALAIVPFGFVPPLAFIVAAVALVLSIRALVALRKGRAASRQAVVLAWIALFLSAITLLVTLIGGAVLLLFLLAGAANAG